MLYTLEEYQKAEWSSAANFILSNGDTTGLTFHADFVAGWKDGVLQKVIDQCGPGTPIVHDSLERCAAFQPYIDPQNGRNCRYEGQIPAEDVGFFRPLAKLPGCNPRWDWDGPMTKPACTPGAEPGYVSPNLQYNGYSFMQIPLAIPGIDGDNPPSQVPSTAHSSFKTHFSRWATSWGNTPQNITSVLRGTQAEVNAAAGGGSNLVRLWGALRAGRRYGLGAGYVATAPPNPVNTAEATRSNHVGTRKTGTYQCAEGHQWTGYPCHTPTPANRDAIPPVATDAPRGMRNAWQRLRRRPRRLE